MTNLFLAIDLPSHAAVALAGLRRDVPGVVWQKPGFLVLCDLGLDDAKVDDLDRLLQAIEVPAFDMVLQGLTFVLSPAPSAICVQADPCDPLEDLAQACTDAARQAGAVVKPDDSGPSVRLARCEGVTREDLMGYARTLDAFGPFEVRADRFVLCSRTLCGGHPLTLTEKVDFQYALG